MRTYYIGFKRETSKTFIILAETKSDVVAGYIERNYNRDYEQAHMGIRAIICTDDNLPENHKYSD